MSTPKDTAVPNRNTKGYILFLDDDRDPLTTTHQPARQIVDMLTRAFPLAEIFWAKTSSSFKERVELYGLPIAVSFDHDIREIAGDNETTGLSCARWLCDRCLTTESVLPQTFVHSSNPAGVQNIMGEIRFYTKHHPWMKSMLASNCPGEVS